MYYIHNLVTLVRIVSYLLCRLVFTIVGFFCFFFFFLWYGGSLRSSFKAFQHLLMVWVRWCTNLRPQQQMQMKTSSLLGFRHGMNGTHGLPARHGMIVIRIPQSQLNLLVLRGGTVVGVH
jgi:hypothetical protein